MQTTNSAAFRNAVKFAVGCVKAGDHQSAAEWMALANRWAPTEAAGQAARELVERVLDQPRGQASRFSRLSLEQSLARHLAASRG